MNYLSLDLEWNAVFSKRHGRYINEIIEIGAVLLDDSFHEIDHFHTFVRSKLTSKLSSRVMELTHISTEEMRSGVSFEKAYDGFAKFAKEKPVVLTWSNTDLHVLLDNLRSFTRDKTLPFLAFYLDLQPYVQAHLGQAGGNQMALGAAAAALGLDVEKYDLHRALDDCRLCAEMLRRTYDSVLLAHFIRRADRQEFYDRLLFKPYYINDIKSEWVDQSQFRFRCESCGKYAKRKTAWVYKNRAFCAQFECRHCARAFQAQVRFKKTFDGVSVRRSTADMKPKEQSSKETAENF